MTEMQRITNTSRRFSPTSKVFRARTSSVKPLLQAPGICPFFYGFDKMYSCRRVKNDKDDLLRLKVKR